MKIGVLGSGSVGRVLGAGLLKHGREVMLGTRDPKKKEIQDWVRETPGARAGTFEEAAQFGDLLVLAALGRAVESIIELAGPAPFRRQDSHRRNQPVGRRAAGERSFEIHHRTERIARRMDSG